MIRLIIFPLTLLLTAVAQTPAPVPTNTPLPTEVKKDKPATPSSVLVDVTLETSRPLLVIGPSTGGGSDAT